MPEAFADLLNDFKATIESSQPYLEEKHFVLGYSGGMDSQVLLNLSAALRELVPTFHFRVIHINHGLQQEAKDWGAFCQNEATKRSVDIQVISLNLDPEQASEAIARDARYWAFQQALMPHEVLMTAHHARDQAETFLLRLLRKSGITGLAAMRALTVHHAVEVYRPLLNVAYAQLKLYAQSVGLAWIEDPSNCDLAFDRNYLRHSVLPIMEKRWPAAVKSIAEVVNYCQEADQLLLDLGRIDYSPLIKNDQALSISGLLALEKSRVKNAFLAWLKDQSSEFVDLSIWSRVENTITTASKESQPVIQFKAVTLRVYRDYLYCYSRDEEKQNLRFTSSEAALASQNWPFQGTALQEFPELKLTSISRPVSVDIVGRKTLNSEWLAAHEYQLYWRSPKKNDRFQLVGKPYAMQLKKLWQEFHVLPWYRYRFPVLECFFDGKHQLLYVPGVGAHPLVAWVEGASGCEITFSISD